MCNLHIYVSTVKYFVHKVDKPIYKNETAETKCIYNWTVNM